MYDYGRGTGPFDGRTVIGGFVYRGPDPELQGHYIFGDGGAAAVAGRRFWSFDTADVPVEPGDPPLEVQDLRAILLSGDASEARYPVSFGEDAVGNLYVTFIFTSGLFRIVTDAFIPGDFDADGRVDNDDLVKWIAGFGIDGDATNALGDANRDGIVDGADFLAWQRNVGHAPVTPTSPSASQIPEPSSLALAMLLGGAALSISRPRRKTSGGPALTGAQCSKTQLERSTVICSDPQRA